MRKYFIHDGHRDKGPFDFEQLRSQSLTKDTPVWYESLENWTVAGNVNELQEIIRKTTPSPPLPKLSKKNPVPRSAVLNSFTTAREIVPEPRKKQSLFIQILIFFIIVGILLLL